MRSRHKRRAPPKHVMEAAHKDPLASQWYTYDPGSPLGGRMSPKARRLFLVLLVLVGVIVLMHRDVIFPAVREFGGDVAVVVNDAIGRKQSSGWSFGSVVALMLGIGVIVGVVIALKEGVVSLEHLNVDLSAIPGLENFSGLDVTDKRKKLGEAITALQAKMAGEADPASDRFNRVLYGLQIVEHIMTRPDFHLDDYPDSHDFLKQLASVLPGDSAQEQEAWVEQMWERGNLAGTMTLAMKMRGLYPRLKMQDSEKFLGALNQLALPQGRPAEGLKEVKS